ncbi:MAG: hypothetical protein R2811_02960 [Flavobacteriales bacterium]
MRRTTLPFALLLSAVMHAQDPLTVLYDEHFHFGPMLYENLEDSAAYAQFRKGLQRADPDVESADSHYRMVWREHQQGGRHTVSRGDGTTVMPTRGDSGVDEFFLYAHFRTADGRDVILVTYERPCAMICRSAIYYVAE